MAHPGHPSELENCGSSLLGDHSWTKQERKVERRTLESTGLRFLSLGVGAVSGPCRGKGMGGGEMPLHPVTADL